MLALSLTLPRTQATASDVDAVARLVQQDFARCGQQVTLSRPLSLAAMQRFQGFTVSQALEQQHYRPYRARGMSLTYHGDLKGLAGALSGRCADRLGYTEFGLSTDTQTVHIIAATPARVDLNQTGRWLAEFLAVTNKARFQGQKCGGKLMNSAPPLTWDARLAGAAARHASDMVRLNFRGHVNPQDRGRAQQRAERLGFRGVVGENIQYGAISPQEAVKQLLTSPEHCENLMDARWKLFGGAVANGTADTLFSTYWIQVFGTER